MSTPILLFLAVDVGALLLLGMLAAIVPRALAGFMMVGLSGLGVLLCLPPLLLRLPMTALSLPMGPPGLSMHFALDPIAGCFLLLAFIAASAVAAVQSATIPAMPVTATRVTAFGIAGLAFAVLAADGVALTIGLGLTGGAIAHTASRGHRLLYVLMPLLILAAICLLTPAGFAPRFDTIRAAPVDPDQATAATMMIITAVTGLVWFRPRPDCWAVDALIAGMIVPLASYLPLRLVADLSGSALQSFWGLALLLTGGGTAVLQGWRSAAARDIDVASLSRRQAGIAMTGVGLGLIARTADLPNAAAFAFAATMLAAIGGSITGPLTLLAAHSLGAAAGSNRLSRLGGLIQSMPSTSAAFAAGLLGQSGLVPGFGFACLWLLLQSILSAPRGGGLLLQLALALSAAAIAASTAFATAAAVRLVGIVLLGRPRTAECAAAQEDRSPIRTILLGLGGLSLLLGLLPGSAIWILASPTIQTLAGSPPGGRNGLGLLSSTIAAPGYLTLSVLLLGAVASGGLMLTFRRSGVGGKPIGPWSGGMPSQAESGFGDPTTQSAGAGFLPALPAIRLVRLPRPSALLGIRRPSASAGVWLLLAACGVVLLVLSVAG